MTPNSNAPLDIGRHRAFRPLLVFLSIGTVCAALSLGGDAALAWARYDPVLIGEGQLWRLATAHFVHLGLSHLVLNLTALGLLVLLFEDLLDPLDWMLALAVSIMAIDAGLYIFSPQVEWYVGLSGALHGVTLFGAIRWCLRRAWSGYVLLAGVAGKVVLEQCFGPSAFSVAASGGPVVVQAHLYGALGGALAAAVAIMLQRGKARPL